MKNFVALTLVGLAASLSVQLVAAQSVDELVAQAVRPLPEDLRADATVYTYDPKTGERKVLRQGSNHVECQPRNEQGFTRCSSTATGPRRDHQAKLRAQGHSGEELQAAMRAAEEAGEVEPVPFGTLGYRLYEKDDRIQLLWVVRLPGATSEELGLSTASQRDNSLAGKGLPWMMREGTPSAHLMIPINSTELSNKGGAMTRLDTKAIKDPVKHSVLALPEDLRAGATVVTYDEATGERKVLRQGTNMIECRTTDDNGFTSCFHEELGKVNGVRAKLRAEGKSPRGDPGGRERGSGEGRSSEVEVRVGVLSAVRGERPNPAALGHAPSGSDVRGPRHADREPARQLARRPRTAVDDARRHRGRPPHDPHQRHRGVESSLVVGGNARCLS